MKKEKMTIVCNLVCALLLLATLIMQFQPFWTCTDCKSHKGEDKGVSIAEYLWLPKHHEPIADEMTDLYREIYGSDYKDPATGRKFAFKVNYILPSVLTVFLGSVVGIVCCLLFHKKFFVTCIPLIVGVAGVYGHLVYPALKVGKNTQAQLVLAIVVTLVAFVSFLLGMIRTICNKVNNRKAAKSGNQQ